MEYLDELLEKLTLTTGIGYAGNVKDFISQELKKLNVDVKIEKDGSVTGFLEGTGDVNIMLACHIDEIGFMVSGIDEAGRIHFSEIGGTDARILPGQEVIILGKKVLRGYIGAKPPHLVSKDERKKVVPVERLFIDTGLSTNVVKKNVKIGDYITFKGKYKRLQGDLRSAKSLDNRVSIACGILVLKELSKVKHISNFYFVATSQEEYTGLGAHIASYKLPVHYAIVVDVTHAEHPDLKEHEYFPLNGGPTIACGATIPSKLHKLLVDTAKKSEIPYQIEALPMHTGTDAEDIAFSRAGIPTCVIGIPLRYMHTPVELVSLKDIERAVRLITQFIKKLESVPI